MNTEQRIKLAEAMGFERVPDQDGAVIDLWTQPGNSNNYFRAPGCGLMSEQIPDPFTSADDDYAVLEWIRSQNYRVYMFTALGPDEHPLDYQIGDYARAALKVIDDD